MSWDYETHEEAERVYGRRVTQANRPTPEQIANEVPEPFNIERLAFLARLTQEGYVIVHPDDVPIKAVRSNGGVGTDPTCNGWNQCRRHIFGGDR